MTITDPAVERYFMTAQEARMLIIYATLVASRIEKFDDRICVLDMGEPVLIQDLAEQMILLSGKRPGLDVPIVYSGLRPGEKLKECLIDQDETHLSEESLEGIIIVRSNKIDQESFMSGLDDCYKNCLDGDKDELFKTIERLVPTASLDASSSFRNAGFSATA